MIELRLFIPLKVIAEGIDEGEFLNITFNEQDVKMQIQNFIKYIEENKSLKATLIKWRGD